MSEITASAQAKEESDKPVKNKRASKKDFSNDPSLNIGELREVAELFNEHGFTDFEYENENVRIRLSKLTAPQAFAPTAPVPSASVSTPSAPVSEHVTAPAAAAEDEDLFKITSPIVGTFYRSPGPDKEPYVKEGSVVSPESVVCIVEAMKLMNEIQAETSGEVVKVYVENGQPVEYGQPLFGIRK
ncbi:MAG TPA: acetyl-CoA carboxylase biotin carboxyl carrier protein [Pyrinomonadaceae bacterium]